MRVQISRHLKVRANAIRSALKTFNDAAAELPEPMNKLDIKTVLNMVFLAEFDNLRYSRFGSAIKEKEWSKPSVRVLTDKSFELLRAKEEIVRLDIEWRRVRTWIQDERTLYLATIEGLLRSGNLVLSSVLKLRWARVERSHQIIQHWLFKTYKLDGFTGNTKPGDALDRELGCAEILSFSSNNSLDTQDSPSGDGENGEDPLALHDELDPPSGVVSGLNSQFEKDADLIDSIGRMAI